MSLSKIDMSQVQTKRYLNALSVSIWKKKVLSDLERHIHEPGYKLNRYKWDTCISHFYTEMINIPADKEDITAGLIGYLSHQTGLTPGELYEIFHKASSSININFCQVPNLEIDERGNRLSVGEVSFRIPPSFFEKIDRNDPMLKDMVLRYSSLNPDTGLFWSLDPELMNGLERSTGLETLECFASPFNFNLKNFCSAFDEDMHLRYKDATCYGDFFNYIKILNVPCRMVINPPYTDRIINKTALVISDYMSRNKDAHIIVALPNWTPLEGIDKIKAIEGSVWQLLPYKSFVLFDPIDQRMIKPKEIDIIFVVNVASDSVRSQQLLTAIVQYMNEAAKLVA